MMGPATPVAVKSSASTPHVAVGKEVVVLWTIEKLITLNCEGRDGPTVWRTASLARGFEKRFDLGLAVRRHAPEQCREYRGATAHLHLVVVVEVDLKRVL